MKSRMRKVALLFVVLAMTVVPTFAHALSLDFSPSAQTKFLGQTASVEVRVNNAGSTLVGDYDFWVHFDPSIVQLSSVLFGSALGGGDGLSFTDVVDEQGKVNLMEISYAWELVPYQNASSFTLCTLLFDTLKVGVSPLSFTGNIGFDPAPALGNGNIPVDVDSVGGGSITVVREEGTPVPEPGTLLLLAPGLAGFALWRRRRN